MTENQFNAKLSKQLKSMGPKTAYLKLSDRFQIGVSDFLIWRNGLTLVMEVKYVQKRPKEGSNPLLLKHPFTGPQLTFLETQALAGNKAFGVIGLESAGGWNDPMLFIEYKDIPKIGNWKWRDFQHASYSRGAFWNFLDTQLGR